MIRFDIRLRTMLWGMVVLRWHQFRWLVSEWAWIFGLRPSSGKWTERVSFLYIYLLLIVFLTPSTLQTIGGLYAAEAQTTPALQVAILRTTIPWIIAIFSLLLIVIPWKAWMLRLTFGDITYLATSPFDRRVLALWRYLEMVVAIPLLALLPMILIAPMFGSIWASDVIESSVRGMFSLALWTAPLLALGWHLSLRQYARVPMTPGIDLVLRLAIVASAVVIALTKPDVLLWPGRLLVLVTMDKASWAWPLLIGCTVIGTGVVWRAAGHLSLTRASAGSDVFARIQQLGIMIILDRRLLFSVLSEARSKQDRAIGTLAPTKGLPTIVARAALYYRRRSGQAVQLSLVGAALGLLLMAWRPTNMLILILTAILLAWQLAPWMARLFRHDLGVPFISQLIPQPLGQRLLVSSIVPVVLVLVGMVPVLIAFNAWMPDWAWGMIPAIWVLSLLGHVEAVGRGSTPGGSNVFTVLLGSIVVFTVLWSITANGQAGILALGTGMISGIGASFALLFFAEVRHHGLSM
jgi:hypothetical protein